MQAPGPCVPILQVAESRDTGVAGTAPVPPQPWQHRINPPVLAVPGSAFTASSSGAVPALSCATEKVPGDISVPGWGQAQSQHWVRKGSHNATSTPVSIQVPPHAGMVLALKMLRFGVTTQPGQHRTLPHTPP